jgi:ubiquinone/menaquinone biosynthesis C-methylase UbiE
MALRGILMRRIVLALTLTLASATAGAQQSRLTEGQIKSATAEMPELIKVFELKPGMTVADVGAGFGAWTVQFGKFLGPKGHVYAVDIGAPQLDAIRDYVKREGLTNVTVIEGSPTSPNLPAGCCDAVLIRDAYHHFTQPEPMDKSVAAAVKAGGRLAVIDFPPRANSAIPEGVPANREGHGVPPQVVEREMGSVLTHERTVAKWMPDSQPSNLFLVLFRKPLS